MSYSVANDKRIRIYCSIFTIACIIYTIIQIFGFEKVNISDEWKVIWVIFQCAIPLPSVWCIYFIIKIISLPFLFKPCGMKNITGEYVCEIVKNDEKINIKMKIKHTIETIDIVFNVGSQLFYATSAAILVDKETTMLIYTYSNSNNSQVGTVNIKISDNKINGYYYYHNSSINAYQKLDMKKVLPLEPWF